ncbi:hypothetical protein Misp01_09660 [Microtetraspora sp. NBRC 13810]|uniref:hypothetical protein n=1 Tax=Microtetraspora sp. NBRC 13810 TaxID=3030990 RepID=UPI0024A2A38B|nr:hypothetical protein [Microtetraspora sp. NBRC 13810]GLW05836.1 hypothetical protein Misp01_09660 [Microtetraspora sp. NBRC 13810]
MLTYEYIEAARRRRWASALLYLTDRCPVGCGHCSVDARPDGPRISDWPLFEQIVSVLCEVESFEIVGISGGEPFTERRGLTFATEELAAAGKSVVLYTSGFWGDPAPWGRRVLGRTSCVVLGTDAFHAARLAEDRVVAAIRAIGDAGCRLVLQAIGTDREAAGLLTRALGASWPDHAEIHVTGLLPVGRARGLRPVTPPRAGRSFGPCTVADAPVVRYDGRVSACCNETVITGGGPAPLRRHARDAAELRAALGSFEADPLLRFIGSHGPGPLAPLAGLQDREFEHICQLCWRLTGRLGADRGGPVAALSLFTGEGP